MGGNVNRKSNWQASEVEECLQYAAADGGGLVRGGKAVGLLAPWVDVAAFHALVDL